MTNRPEGHPDLGVTRRRIFICMAVGAVVTITWAACCVFDERLNFAPSVKSTYLKYFDLPLFVAGTISGIIGTYVGCTATQRKRRLSVLLSALSIVTGFALLIQGALLIELYVNARKVNARM
jgi:hypothetical protein